MKTVNFIEAVNSGKRFRPLSFEDWIEIRGDYLFGDNAYIKCKDFYNSQFELEEKEITIAITESQFDAICNKNIGNYICVGAVGFIKKELGFN